MRNPHGNIHTDDKKGDMATQMRRNEHGLAVEYCSADCRVGRRFHRPALLDVDVGDGACELMKLVCQVRKTEGLSCKR